jgi:hypothetical protein
MLVAYLLAGNGLTGSAEGTPLEQLDEEIRNACFKYDLDVNLVYRWAESLLIPPDKTFSDAEVAEFVPTKLESLGFTLLPYQVRCAAWAAYRLGSIMALDCGTRKTSTCTAAVIAAARTGRCRPTRCHIYAPVNAMSVWDPYCVELRKVFEDVGVFSIDSAHNYKGTDRTLGGAVIWDELHKLKGDEGRRGQACFYLRPAYEWSCGLTGTLLHAGPEGILQMQDLALPGLSRFMDKWRFGEAFECVYEKTFEGRNGRKQTKSAVGMPPEEQQAAFTRYLNRGIQSLSYVSPEIADVLNMPEHEMIDMSDWKAPDWVLDTQKALSAENPKSRVYWAPDCVTVEATKEYLGAIALAEMEEHPDHELPTFAKVTQIACKEGRIDRAIAKRYVDGVARYNWIYPGSRPDFTDPDTIPAGPKIQAVRQWLEANPTESLVVAGVGTLTVYLVAKMLVELGVKFHIIRGGVSSEDRDVYKKEFQDGKVRVMLLQQKAGAESITLTRASTTMLLDHDWSPPVYTQFIHRTYRSGQTEKCEHYDMIFGMMQTQVVRRLRRGKRFDAQVRAELEKMLWDEAALISPT